MIGIYVSVPVACFRKGAAREYLETEPLPPPATCYGMLLSLVGEADRRRHIGCRVTAVLLGDPPISTVLRTLWRVKSKPLGSSGNTRPDFQQLLTQVELVVWLDSSDEQASNETTTLEARVGTALNRSSRHLISRFGGLCLGESTHLVDELSPLDDRRRENLLQRFDRPNRRRAFLTNGQHAPMTLPVWVDHVGSAGTRHVVGNLVGTDLLPPNTSLLPQILPPGI